MDLYEAIYHRRDVRRFRSDPVEDDVLARILDAAHHAGSVGFMQPWNFIVIRSVEVRKKVHEVFVRENSRAAENYTGEQRSLYDSLKLAGILEAPVSLAVTCDPHRKGPAVLGRNSMPETDLYSTCCAIQNLWLAARTEGKNRRQSRQSWRETNLVAQRRKNPEMDSAQASAILHNK